MFVDFRNIIRYRRELNLYNDIANISYFFNN